MVATAEKMGFVEKFEADGFRRCSLEVFRGKGPPPVSSEWSLCWVKPDGSDIDVRWVRTFIDPNNIRVHAEELRASVPSKAVQAIQYLS